MIEAWFFERFELIAHAPDAVAKMRELVLELAVQGKLVPQEPDDESAAVLLKRIHADCSQTTKRRGLRRKDTVADVVPPYLLPNGWTWTSLGSIADWGSGSTPPRGNYELYGGSISWLKSGELNDNRALAGSDEQVTELAVKQGSFRHNKPGDVLFAMYGATVGKAAILAEPAVTNQAVCGCTPCSGVLNHYLFFYLVSQRQKFRNASEGGAQPNFSKDKILLYPFPLPPLAEQKRIVAKVDELMALCDQLEVQQQERETRKSVLVRASLARFAEAPTPANLGFLFHKSYEIPPTELRTAILALAFAGKLVPQDPDDEPAAVLLERARTEKSRLILKGVVTKEPWADRLKHADVLYDLPSGWEWTHVSDVVEKVTVGYVGPMKEQYRESGIPFLRCQNVRKNRYEPAGLAFISKEFHCSIAKSTLLPGDVVVTRSGNVGVTCVIPETLPEANCSDLVIIKRPLALVPAFLSYFINSIAGGQIEAKTVGIALTHFNTQSVAQLTVALPPLAEQRRIVAKVDQLMALVDELERQHDTSRTSASKLLDAIVHELTNRS